MAHTELVYHHESFKKFLDIAFSPYEVITDREKPILGNQTPAILYPYEIDGGKFNVVFIGNLSFCRLSDPYQFKCFIDESRNSLNSNSSRSESFDDIDYEELREMLLENFEKEKYKLSIDLNVLNHLGIGLYSNTPAVLTEIVANSWDADANVVDVKISNDKILILDDGHGMNKDDLIRKFLTVGYDRRNHNEEKTPAGRQCMGRKGIGKLAMFSLSHEVHVITKKEGSNIEGFKIDVEELKSKIENKKEYYTDPITDFSDYPEFDDVEHGTLIVLKNLQSNINKTSSYFRRRIARRFSVIGERENFKVFIDGQEVTIADRGFYPHIQFIWFFGEEDEETLALCKNYKRKRVFSGETASGEIIKGFIASVKLPEQLKGDEGENNNAVTLLANGRVFEEDIQKRIDDSRVFNSYLVGELRYDVLDDNDKPDIAVSSRQSIQENDHRFGHFIAHVHSRLADIARDWDMWRRELGAEEVINEFPKIQDWIDGLDTRFKSKAKQLVNKVNTMRFNGSSEEQYQQRKNILKSQILAFEKLKINQALDEVESIDIEKNIDGFRSVLLTVRDIEASLYRDITHQRLSVIKKLDEAQNDEVTERIVQDHIYENLWLIDSRWEYKEYPTHYEETITKHLREAYPDTSEGARFDIGYRTTSGRYVVLELKKPGLYVSGSKLVEQGEKYSMGLEEYFRKHPDPFIGNLDSSKIDVIFIVDRVPELHRVHENRLEGINGKIMTYRSIVNQSYHAYKDYLEKSKYVNRIDDILENM